MQNPRAAFRRGTILLLLAAAACSDTSAPTSGIVPAATRPSNVATTETIFAERFARGTGQPQTVTRAITTSNHQAPFTLRVRNGSSGGAHRVSSATLQLDGKTLLGPSDFSQQGGEWAIEITPADVATLSIQLTSAPGSYLDVSLEGARRGVRFCPGEGAGSFADLRQAIDAAPEGGTVLICDGTHVVQFVPLGSKTITLQAEHPLEATIDGAGARWSFIVAEPFGVTFRGLRFVNATGMNIFVLSRAGGVRVEHSVFHPYAQTDPNASWGTGIVAVASTTSSLFIDNTAFLGGDAAVNAAAPQVAITNSTFQGQRQTPLGASEPGMLRATGNEFRGCSNWCIGTFSGRSSELRRNALKIDITNPSHGIWLSGGAHQVSDNTITGTGGDRTTDFFSWPVREAINIEQEATATIERNVISGAYTALNFANASGSATDNTVSNVLVGVRFFNAAMQVHRNDITDYHISLSSTASPSGSATCNWWGDAAGPQNVQLGYPPPNVPHAPWATTTIANRSDVTCTP